MPVGREEVVAAILAAAADLFAERGPAATSIREIAARAKVNHGLVFRHFGAKEQLVGAVLDQLAVSRAALVDAGAPAAEIERAAVQHTRVMARTLLDGYPGGQLQSQFPGALQLLDELPAGRASGQSARLAAAHALALQFGWRLFEPFVRGATGIELQAEELHQAVDAEVARILESYG